ncbi:MAG: hypothetical protein L0Z46_05585 [Nitrospiraceae bacterium]|nr:hypothetical protein [Nitrospiraceae bacterium]
MNPSTRRIYSSESTRGMPITFQRGNVKAVRADFSFLNYNGPLTVEVRVKNGQLTTW